MVLPSNSDPGLRGEEGQPARAGRPVGLFSAVEARDQSETVRRSLGVGWRRRLLLTMGGGRREAREAGLPGGRKQSRMRPPDTASSHLG